MTKFSKYFTFFTKFFIVLCFEQKAVACVGEKHNKNSSKPINYGRVRGVLFICYLFILSTNSLFLAVSSTQAGLKPLLIALRTDFIFDQAAQ